MSSLFVSVIALSVLKRRTGFPAHSCNMPRVSDLNQDEISYLQSQIQTYHSTPASEKEAFRLACAKHIIGQRGLDETNYLIEQFHDVSFLSSCCL